MKFVNTLRNLFLFSTFAFTLTACDEGKNMEQTIAYVDISSVLEKSGIGKLEAEHTQKVKERLLSAEKDAEKSYVSLSEAKVKESRIADAQILNRQWQAEQQHARMLSIQAIRKAIETYRQEKKISIVVGTEYIVAADKTADISKQVAAQLKDTKVDYGKLPVITIKKGEDEPKKSDGDSSEKSTSTE